MTLEEKIAHLQETVMTEARSKTQKRALMFILKEKKKSDRTV